MPLPHPWSEHSDGWSAFVSDLMLGTTDEIKTPRGERINLKDPIWVPQYDRDDDIIQWRRILPGGKQVIIFND
jgi:hypothetical protein